MCGIAGFYVRKIGRTAFDPSRLAAELLLSVDHRGGDATGYAAFAADGSMQMQKASCNAKPFLTGMRRLPEDTQTVLLHTRWATQGKASFPENNHPVCSGGTYVVHNGHISNDRELFRKLGTERMGFVDSEIIPAMIVSKGWHRAGEALEALDGAYAIAAVSALHPGELILAKGDISPLIYAVTDNLIVWASEMGALTSAWRRALGTPPDSRKIRHLSSGQMLRVAADGKIEHESFQAMQQYVWSGSVSNACVVSDNETQVSDSDGKIVTGTTVEKPLRLGDKLEDALAELEARKRGTVKAWNGQGWEDYDSASHAMADAWIRCGCCDEYVDPLTTDEAFGELVCSDCFRALRDENLIMR